MKNNNDSNETKQNSKIHNKQIGMNKRKKKNSVYNSIIQTQGKTKQNKTKMNE